MVTLHVYSKIDNYCMLTSGTKHLEDQIYAEIRGRIKEDDISAPLRRGPYYYYKRTLEGKEYVQYCRRLAVDDGAPLSVYDTMSIGLDAPPEHIILDENIKAQEHAYYSIGAFKVGAESVLMQIRAFSLHEVFNFCSLSLSLHHVQISPNNKLVAYAEDTKGDEIYTVYVIDAESGAPVGKPLHGITGSLEWAGDESLVYITMDEILRPDKVKI